LSVSDFSSRTVVYTLVSYPGVVVPVHQATLNHDRRIVIFFLTTLLVVLVVAAARRPDECHHYAEANEDEHACYGGGDGDLGRSVVVVARRSKVVVEGGVAWAGGVPTRHGWQRGACRYHMVSC
jgi:hypothetical protein